MNNQLCARLRNRLFNEVVRGLSALPECSSSSQIRLVITSNFSSNYVRPLSTSLATSNTLNGSLLHDVSYPNSSCYPNFIPSRSISIYRLNSPDPKKIRMNLKFKVHYPEDGKYTIVPLKTTKLAGRDPETGRIVYRKLGGGHKQRFRWVDPHRYGPMEEDSFLIERVINIQRDPIRTGKIALVGEGNNLRYLMASEHMKAGDLIKTTSHIYRNPVRPAEGDAYPVASLPPGTLVHALEIIAGEGAKLALSAGSSATIIGKENERIIAKLPSRRLISLNPKCMATVGRVSNVDWKDEIVGSAQRQRWLGNRPASGLKFKKDGYCGRKRRKTKKPLKYDDVEPEPTHTYIKLNHSYENTSRPIVPCVKLRRR